MKTTTLGYFLLFSLFITNIIILSAQVRIVRLDPSTNSVTLRNFSGSTEPISNLWFCNFPSYDQVSDMTTTTDLAPNEEIIITSTVNFDVADGEFGLYNTNSFGSSSAMEDYLQWGSAGHGREGVANTAGIWTSGTFISDAPPFEYIGNGSENGVNFWQTALSLNDEQKVDYFKIKNNPVENDLKLLFEIPINKASLSIYDITGKKVFDNNFNNSNEITINVSSWSQGLYLLKLSTSSENQVKRFIKQ